MVETPKGYKGPQPPREVEIEGKKNPPDEMTTKAVGQVYVSAIVDSSKGNQKVRLLARYSSTNFKGKDLVRRSDWVQQGRRVGVQLGDLKRNTLYKVRLYTVGAGNPDKLSLNFNGVSFWTNRTPVVETVVPTENSEYDENQVILFDWKYTDPDNTEDPKQVAYQIKYRTRTQLGAVGAWAMIPQKGWVDGPPGKQTFRTFKAAALRANTTYDWTVRARDPQGSVSEWAPVTSFFIRGVQSPPLLSSMSPRGGLGTAVIVGEEPLLFEWDFRDPGIVDNVTDTQVQADIRWRVVGSGVHLPDTEDDPDNEGWSMLIGDGIIPGTSEQWEVAANRFTPGFQYEWQVRTYSDRHAGIPSGWSESAKFVAAPEPGYANTAPLLAEEVQPLGALGCGQHRVFIFDRGGQILRGEIKPLARVQWGRKRDDIGNCLITTNGFDQDCCELLGMLQSWRHELVIYRDDTRVFEGPVTRITYTATEVEIEAKDVMAYLYRRVMRQGYNDAYRRIDRTPLTKSRPGTTERGPGGPYTIVGKNTVVDRALQITLNALAYQDPNVLPYVTAIRNTDDATQSRSVTDMSKTAWEEIDDLAATAGLDYTTIGRRIVYWDTHRMIGRLPEMRDGDFSDPVIVTEYGMQTANWYAVTNNSGLVGFAYPQGLTADDWWSGKPVPGTNGFATDYGPVEMVSSAYGEREGAVASTEALTPKQREEALRGLREQARRGIADRHPNPVVVRVPDNSSLNPQVNLGINQLVPGIWIPLRATLTCRKLSQWQKLDSLDVEEVGGQEQIRVTMSPAPHGGEDDPDLSGGSEEG